MTPIAISSKPEKSTCSKCGAELFGAFPGVTTQEEIREFAARCNLPEKEEIIADGWIHPGTYCPNCGCISRFSF